jgi:hypothetical protein
MNLDIKNEKIIIISYQPFPELIEIIENIKPEKFIYISVHDYSEMLGVSDLVVKCEQNIIKKSDLFTTDSSSLFTKLTSKSVEDRIISLEAACPNSIIEKSKLKNYNSSILKKLIYFGTIASYLDWELLKKLEKNGYQVDFLGYEYDIKLNKILSGSILYESRDFENAYDLFMNYDAIILPYQVNSRNDHVIPAKIYECFSLGMPIYTPNMKWTHDKNIKNLIFIYNDFADLSLQLQKFNYDDFIQLRKEMINIAEKNSWDKRFKLLSNFINGVKYEKIIK